ncbi:MAG: hypothetical protein NTZ58_03525 [Solirubrobacterales bacterium]|nr:hypothetical protein [Solirubrobacterales bacterium]
MTTAGAEPGHIVAGKVLTDTGEILKKSFGTIWVIALILFVPVAILSYFSQDSGIISVIYSLALLLASLYMTGTMVRVVQDVEADGRVDATVGDLLGSISAKLWPLFLLGIVTSVLLTIGFILFIIPGIILALMWFVAVPVLVAEDKGVFASMSRSSELTKGNRWRLIWLFVIIYVLLFIIAFIVGLLAAITPILGVIGGVLIAIVAYPYLSIIIAVTYYELLEAHGESKPGPGVATMAPPSGDMPPPSGEMPA